MLVGESGFGSTNDSQTDIFIFCHHLSVWYCIDTVGRNSLLVTHGVEGFVPLFQKKISRTFPGLRLILNPWTLSFPRFQNQFSSRLTYISYNVNSGNPIVWVKQISRTFHDLKSFSRARANPRVYRVNQRKSSHNSKLDQRKYHKEPMKPMKPKSKWKQGNWLAWKRDCSGRDWFQFCIRLVYMTWRELSGSITERGKEKLS